MSYDYRVVTSQQPTDSFVRGLLSQQAGLEVQGSFAPGAGALVVERHTKTKSTPAFVVDSPCNVENEDLDDELACTLLAPRWLIEISCPAAASNKDVNVARLIAKQIAKEYDGALLDPQQDRVLWPTKRPTRYRNPQAEERIRLITLEWFLPNHDKTADGAAEFVSITRRTCSEATPTRFGTYEPLQGKLLTGEVAPFTEIWRQSSKCAHGETFFWRAKPPCYGGTASFPDPRDDFMPPRAQRCIRVSTKFDGRALAPGSDWLLAVSKYFLTAAIGLDAFYAAGYVERGVIAKRSLWYDGSSESYRLTRSRWWLGLPSVPTWLTWFGKPYSSLLNDTLPGAEDHGDGLLLSLGNRPLDLDELVPVFPAIPKSLLERPNDKDVGPAALIPELT